MSVRLHGLLAEFAEAEQLRCAVQHAREDGRYSAIEAYSPYPIKGLDAALGARRNRMPFWMLLGAIGGGAFTYWLEWYSAVVDYPLNIGGRPLFSWPAFIPPAVEMTILWAVLFGVGAVLYGARLPRVHHPLFANHEFERATSDRFFLLVRGDDPLFDAQATQAFLENLSPLSVV
ncbi:MAG TPA: DUF3341 domain-containing protein, partial [Rhodanobacteraceae bacterium]